MSDFKNFLKAKIEKIKEKIKKHQVIVIFVAFLFFSSLSFLILIMKAQLRFSLPVSIPHFPRVSLTIISEQEIKKFSSEEEFKDYLREAREGVYQYLGYPAMALSPKRARIPSPMEALPEMEVEGIRPERVSETTVQVVGIDEPDIVKTDGENIYLSLERVWRKIFFPSSENLTETEKRIVPPPPSRNLTKIIKAFPPEEMGLRSEIEESGQLLLVKDKNVLVIFSKNKGVRGYDISNPKNPKKKWEVKLNDRNYLVTARLYKDKVYLVTKERINEVHPCPIKPFTIGGEPLTISCQEIYYPIKPIPVDVVFVAMILDPISGKIVKRVSFVGSSDNSVVYMSKQGIYITYSFYEEFIKFFTQFLTKECQDLFPKEFLNKLAKLNEYDISQQAKMVELQIILEKYSDSLDEEERIRLENEIENRGRKYFKKHLRELVKTGIVKIDANKFDITAKGSVPGVPLNQFALDEYKNNLRIATTIGEGGFWSGVESVNDVYVLDRKLKIIGEIKNLGLTERIYAVRFIEDKGYVVTFRQIDPFYVIDLSNPKKPKLEGELKIPGYSSYLHPITKDKILGIGKEGWEVKISLFDVSDPKNPTEKAKYILKEGWSDILNTHHAFLLDSKHKIFFLPAGGKGYIFSYKDDELKMVKAITGISAKRAIYIDDYLYIIGERKISVLNEINWEEIKEVEL